MIHTTLVVMMWLGIIGLLVGCVIGVIGGCAIAFGEGEWLFGGLTFLVSFVVGSVLIAYIVTHVDFGNDCGPGTHQADVGGTYIPSGKGGITYVPNLKCVRDLR